MSPRPISTLWISFAGFIVLGLPQGVVGVAWPTLRVTFHQPLAALGVALLVGTAGYAIAGTATGVLTQRRGRGWVLAAAGLCGSAGLAACMLAPGWLVFLAGYLLLGVAGGILDAAINAHVSLTRGIGAMNLLHGTWGLGAALGPPLAVSIITVTGSWRGVFTALLILYGGLTAVFVATRPLWTVATGGRDHHGPGGQATRLWLLLASLGAFFLYTGVEVAAGQWSYSMLIAQGTAPTLGAAVVTGYWAALSGGRVLMAGVARHLTAAQVLIGSLALAVAGALLLLVTPLGLLLLALGLAPIFPTFMALTPARFGSRAAASMAGYQVAAATAGGGAVPAVAGLLFQRAGLGLLPLVVATCVAAMAVLVLIAGAIGRRRAS